EDILRCFCGWFLPRFFGGFSNCRRKCCKPQSWWLLRNSWLESLSVWRW
ncbi:hypothetical protein X975_24287, partial [Stegodyphus mimosarum]